MRGITIDGRNYVDIGDLCSQLRRVALDAPPGDPYGAAVRGIADALEASPIIPDRERGGGFFGEVSRLLGGGR